MSIDYPYIIEGASGGFSSEINGYRFVVKILLDGVVGDNDVAQMFAALTDPNVPLIGSDLSGVDLDLTGCWLRDITCVTADNNKSRLTLTYQQSPFNTVRISTQTQVSELDSTNDKNGDPVQLRYLYPDTYGGTEPTARDELLRETYTDLQGGTYRRLVPESTRTYTIREAVDGDLIARSFIGTVNEFLWQDGDPGTWMLSSVTGTTDESQESPLKWVNSYTFQFKTDGWNPDVVFTDSNTNEPVPDPVDEYAGAPDNTNVGSVETIDAYEETDFSLLFPAVDV